MPIRERRSDDALLSRERQQKDTRTTAREKVASHHQRTENEVSSRRRGLIRTHSTLCPSVQCTDASLASRENSNAKHPPHKRMRGLRIVPQQATPAVPMSMIGGAQANSTSSGPPLLWYLFRIKIEEQRRNTSGASSREP